MYPSMMQQGKSCHHPNQRRKRATSQTLVAGLNHEQIILAEDLLERVFEEHDHYLKHTAFHPVHG